MNEELQREIVNILRAMKDGSPDAFRVLVEQRRLRARVTELYIALNQREGLNQ